jgi:hypothetical protein
MLIRKIEVSEEAVAAFEKYGLNKKRVGPFITIIKSHLKFLSSKSGVEYSIQLIDADEPGIIEIVTNKMPDVYDKRYNSKLLAKLDGFNIPGSGYRFSTRAQD